MTTLTKDNKERMIRSIMGDIPQIDYQTAGADFIKAAVVEKLPPKVKAVWQDKEYKKYIKVARVSTDCGRIRATVPWFSDYAYSREIKEFVGDETWNEFLEFGRLNTQQIEARCALQNQMEANFSTVRTFKQFRERFPELEKYLPHEPGSSANLPVTSDLADRLRAAGLALELAEAS